MNNKGMIILGLDLATTTGWVVIGVRDTKIEIIEAGSIEFKAKLFGEKMKLATSWIKEMLSLWKPSFVVIEEMNILRNIKTLRNLLGMRGVIAKEAYIYNSVDCNFMIGSQAKKTIGIKGNAKKEEVAEYLKAMFNEDKDINWNDYNQTDALCIATALGIEIQNASKKNKNKEQ